MSIRHKLTIVVSVLLLLLTPFALTADKNDFIHTSPGSETAQLGNPVKAPERLIGKSTLSVQKLSITIEWNFETGWQGWTHTNGLGFPSGWSVQSSNYESSYTPPNAGDSTFWIDSDSAADLGVDWTTDTALSPKIVADSTTSWLQYGVGFNNTGSDFLEVGLKYYNGASWVVTPLVTYYTDTVCVDLIDISAYNTYDSLQIYFYYNDTDISTYYAAFDNVIISDKPNYWEILPSLPRASSGHSMASIGDGFIYLLHLGSSTSDTVLKYDIVNETWSVDTSNPYGPARYGCAKAVNNKIYRIGGAVSWPTPISRVDIYDPVARTWNSGTLSPYGLIEQSMGVYKDSLIYSFGGGNWSLNPMDSVCIYDTYNDSWVSATNLPDARGTTGGGIIDSFAVVACGYKSDGTYGDDYTVGIINSSDPTIINWSSYAAIPGIDTTGRYRVPSAVDSYNKEFYIVGGQNTSGASNQTLSYNPYTDTWVEEMPKNVAFANVTALAVAADIRTPLEETSIYAAGGYNFGYLSDAEQYHTADTSLSGIPDDIDGSNEFGFISVSQLATPGYASITYLTSKSSFTTLKVYDLMGRNVKTLVDRAREAPGTRTAYWNYNNDNGNPVSNGVYFLRLESDGKIAKQKMILIR